MQYLVTISQTITVETDDEDDAIAAAAEMFNITNMPKRLSSLNKPIFYLVMILTLTLFKQANTGSMSDVLKAPMATRITLTFTATNFQRS